MRSDKETGFFTESVGSNEVFSQKPGFWAPCVRLNLIIDKEQFSFILAIIIGLVPQAIALKEAPQKLKNIISQYILQN